MDRIVPPSERRGGRWFSDFSGNEGNMNQKPAQRIQELQALTQAAAVSRLASPTKRSIAKAVGNGAVPLGENIEIENSPLNRVHKQSGKKCPPNAIPACEETLDTRLAVALVLPSSHSLLPGLSTADMRAEIRRAEVRCAQSELKASDCAEQRDSALRKSEELQQELELTQSELEQTMDKQAHLMPPLCCCASFIPT